MQPGILPEPSLHKIGDMSVRSRLMVEHKIAPYNPDGPKHGSPKEPQLFNSIKIPRRLLSEQGLVPIRHGLMGNIRGVSESIYELVGILP